MRASFIQWQKGDEDEERRLLGGGEGEEGKEIEGEIWSRGKWED